MLQGKIYFYHCSRFAGNFTYARLVASVSYAYIAQMLYHMECNEKFLPINISLVYTTSTLVDRFEDFIPIWVLNYLKKVVPRFYKKFIVFTLPNGSCCEHAPVVPLFPWWSTNSKPDCSLQTLRRQSQNLWFPHKIHRVSTNQRSLNLRAIFLASDLGLVNHLLQLCMLLLVIFILWKVNVNLDPVNVTTIQAVGKFELRSSNLHWFWSKISLVNEPLNCIATCMEYCRCEYEIHRNYGRNKTKMVEATQVKTFNCWKLQTSNPSSKKKS